MDTLIYGDGTKTILLRMKRKFQIYIKFVEILRISMENYRKVAKNAYINAIFIHSQAIARGGRKH